MAKLRAFAKKAANYLAFVLAADLIYGVLLYLFVTWLAGYSLLLAYAGNLLFILAVLGYDEFAIRRVLRPDTVHASIQKAGSVKDREDAVRYYRWALKHYVSFKSFLFVFYIVVLIFAQVIRFHPGLVGEGLANFVGIIDYSVILLVAFNDFKEQFSKDKNRTQLRLEEFNQYLAEHPF